MMMGEAGEEGTGEGAAARGDHYTRYRAERNDEFHYEAATSLSLTTLSSSSSSSYHHHFPLTSITITFHVRPLVRSYTAHTRAQHK